MRSLSDSAVLPAKDSRWKRGRPVTFSTRRFTTQGLNGHGNAWTGNSLTSKVPALCCSRRSWPIVSPPATILKRALSSQESPCTRNPEVASAAFDHSNKHIDAQSISTMIPSADRLSHYIDSQQKFRQKDYMDLEDPSDRSSTVRQISGPQTSHDCLETEPLSQRASQSTDSGSACKTPTNGEESNYLGIESLQTDDGESFEEHAELSFQIPDEDLRTAMAAPEQTRASYWNTKLYRGPEGECLSTHYCKTMEVAERVAQYFLTEKVVGFDIEWKPWGQPSSIKDNASLIQLACENRIALFHIALFPGWNRQDLLPPTLRIILESPDIYKVGVAVKGDFRRLQKYLGLRPQGVFELSRLHNLVEWYETDPSKVSNRLVALATQVHQHLRLPLYKGGQLLDDPSVVSSVRESDWSLPLGVEQIHYAAADAYAGFRLYDVLEAKRKLLRPIPHQIGLCDGDTLLREPRPRVKCTVKKTRAREEVIPKQKEEDEDEDLEEGFQDYQTASKESTQTFGKPNTLYHENVIGNLPYVGKELAPPIDHPESAKRISQMRKNLYQARLDSSVPEGPDPGYPTLPQLPNDDESQLDEVKGSNEDLASDIYRKILPNDLQAEEADDEYPDSELEEAFRDMDLGDDHKLARPCILKGSTASETDDPVILAEIDDDADVGIVLTIDNAEMLHNACESGGTPINEVESVTTLPNNVIRTPEYDTATSWAQSYLVSTIPSPTSTNKSRVRATVTHLRAYHLWYHHDLSVQKAAEHLRDPPLAQSTVIGYVLQAITLENLEYDQERIRKMIMTLPIQLRKGRWRWIAGKVGIS